MHSPPKDQAGSEKPGTSNLSPGVVKSIGFYFCDFFLNSFFPPSARELVWESASGWHISRSQTLMESHSSHESLPSICYRIRHTFSLRVCRGLMTFSSCHNVSFEDLVWKLLTFLAMLGLPLGRHPWPNCVFLCLVVQPFLFYDPSDCIL